MSEIYVGTALGRTDSLDGGNCAMDRGEHMPWPTAERPSIQVGEFRVQISIFMAPNGKVSDAQRSHGSMK
jgi:hypothetical protein